MEAQLAEKLPSGAWQYEPKWDGLRCLAFRDGDEVSLQSKAGEPLTRYFPELVRALSSLRARRFDQQVKDHVDGRRLLAELPVDSPHQVRVYPAVV